VQSYSRYLDGKCSQLEEQIAQKNGLIARKNFQIAQRDALLVQRDEVIAHMGAELAKERAASYELAALVAQGLGFAVVRPTAGMKQQLCQRATSMLYSTVLERSMPLK
jgi:hypothetical protein